MGEEDFIESLSKMSKEEILSQLADRGVSAEQVSEVSERGPRMVEEVVRVLGIRDDVSDQNLVLTTYALGQAIAECAVRSGDPELFMKTLDTSVALGCALMITKLETIAATGRMRQ